MCIRDRCKKVICFEPDPVAFNVLQNNIRRNGIANIFALNAAVSDESGIANLSSFGGSLGDSMSSLLNGSEDDAASASVICLSWEIVKRQIEDVDVGLIKMDVEGSEFVLLPRMEGYLSSEKPDLWLSFHVPFLEAAKQKEEYFRAISILERCYVKCFDESFNEISFSDLKDSKYFHESHSFLFTK